jgi:hypothetical protein
MPSAKTTGRQHCSVQRLGTTNALSTLLRNDTIDQNMHDAGQTIRALFQQAQTDPLRTALLTRIPSSQHDPLIAGDARVRLTKLLDRLGEIDSATSRCAWAVLGEGRSLPDWAMRESWSGRPIRTEAAYGSFLASCAMRGLAARVFSSDRSFEADPPQETEVLDGDVPHELVGQRPGHRVRPGPANGG